MGASCSLADFVSNALRQEIEVEEAAEGPQGGDLPLSGGQAAHKDGQQHLPDAPRLQVRAQTAGHLRRVWLLSCCCMPCCELGVVVSAAAVAFVVAVGRGLQCTGGYACEPTGASVLMQARDQQSFVVIDDPDLRQTSTGLAVMAQHLQLIALARQHVLT